MPLAMWVGVAEDGTLTVVTWLSLKNCATTVGVELFDASGMEIFAMPQSSELGAIEEGEEVSVYE